MTQDTLQRAKERYQDASDAFREQRTRMLEDLRFSNPAKPEQWDEQALQIRQQGPDGARPCLTLDHTNQYIAQVVNDARQNKPSISFMPSSGRASQEVAKALDGIVRHIEYQSRAQIAYDTAVEHAARVGLGWIRLIPEVVDPELNYQEVRIKRVHDPLSIVCNPDWSEPDGADITHGFVESNMTHAAFKAKWPKASQATWDSNLRDSGWVGSNTIRVCEYFDQVKSKSSRLIVRDPVTQQRKTMTEDEFWQYEKENGVRPLVEGQYMAEDTKVEWCTMSGAEILEKTEFPSRFIPLVPMMGYELWIEGKRYLAGMVRRMMESQRAYNYERSAWVEAVALQPKAPFMATSAAIEGHEAEWGGANKRNKAYLPWNAYDEEGRQQPKPERAQPPALPAAFAQGAQFAEADLQASIGMYRASIGAPTQEHSGVAIRAKQREGDTANFHYIDNEARSIERVGRIVLDMTVRLYDEPREARILGENGEAKPVRIDPTGQPYAIDGDVATINPATGTYDVRVKAGPSYTTLREEASEHLAQIMQGSPAMAAVVAPLWARMQDWPEADKLSKALLAISPPPVQQALSEGAGVSTEELQQQLIAAQQQAEQLQQMLQMAGDEIEKLRAEDKKTTLEYLDKAARLELDEYSKQTDRMKVMQAAIPPEQVAALAAQLVMQSLQREPLQGGEELENVTQDFANLPDDEPYGGPMGAPPGIQEPSMLEAAEPTQPASAGFSLPASSEATPLAGAFPPDSSP